ncbi:threonine aldolase, partial [Halomonas sp. SUBG004]
MQYLLEANQADDLAYGNDPLDRPCRRPFSGNVRLRLRRVFVFNGTAANSLALSAMGRSYHSVICHELAHIETDECGGPEFFSNGAKLLTSPGANGKLTPKGIEALVT